MRIRTANNRRKRKEQGSLEDRIYNQQIRMIDAEFGNNTLCNLGWAVVDYEGFISVSTKVYAEDLPILTSIGNYRTGIIEHRWE